ncbi:MAG: CoA transferase [Dehalococcoidia bacterium]
MKKAPLAGIRVIEHGQLLAVPFAARMLADLGAEVIKIEAAIRLDSHRQTTYPDNDPGAHFWDRGGTYHNENRGKLGITLDLRNPIAIEVCKDLVRISDVVVENFTTRVMQQFGLDYAELVKIKPDIIMMSSTGYGHTGPWKDFKAVGPTTESASGVAVTTGYDGLDPVMADIPYTDYVAADQNVLGVLLALYRRTRTGRGSDVDISQVEAQASLAGELYMDAALNGTSHAPHGNRHPMMAPHDFFPCAGEDRWCAIAVSSDEEWRRLQEAMGNPAWAADARFAALAGRQANLAELDAKLAEWTRAFEAFELMTLLQANGVAAGVAQTGRDLVFNEHLAARGFFDWVTPPASTEIPEKPYSGTGWHFSESEHGLRRGAPLLGEHNEYVLRNILGYSAEKYATIVASGALGGAPEEFNRPHPVALEVLQRQGRVVEIDPDYLEHLRRFKETHPPNGSSK